MYLPLGSFGLVRYLGAVPARVSALRILLQATWHLRVSCWLLNRGEIIVDKIFVLSVNLFLRTYPCVFLLLSCGIDLNRSL